MLPTMGSMTPRGMDRQGNEVWELAVSLGFDPKTGTYPRHTERFHGPKKNARKHLHTLEDKYEGGQLMKAPVQTVGEFLELWLEGLPARNLSEHTVAAYRSYTRATIIPEIGRVRLTALRAEHIDAMLAHQRERGLKPGSLRKIKNTLSSALTDARRRGYISVNPARDAVSPAIRQEPMVTLTEDQTDEFLATIAGDPFYHSFFLMAVTTGMRREELCRLRDTDVDLVEGVLTVQKSKTDKGRRLIRLHARTVQALAQHSLFVDERRRRHRGRWEEHGLVFPAVRLWTYRGKVLAPGRPLQPHSVTQRWEQCRKEKLVPEDMRFHDLRHTHATQLLRAGVNVKVVSERLGHANVSITLNTYAHVLPDMQQSAVDAMGWLNVLK